MRKRSEARERRVDDDPPAVEREFVIAVPSDPANEQVVLAAMLVGDADTCDRLLKRAPTAAFYAKPHKILRDAIAEARRQNLALDPATLHRLAPDLDVRVAERLPQARPELPENLEFHVGTLEWDWRRAVATRGPIAALLDAVQDPRAEPDRVRAAARQVGEAFEGASVRHPHLRDPVDVVREAMIDLRKRVAGEAFFPYGIDGLDHDENGERRCRPGAAPGNVTILTGLSGSGKTTLAAHAILGIARQGRKVLVGAWEVRAPMTLELLATISLGWSRSKVLDGLLDDEELERLEERMFAISEHVVFVDNPFKRGSVKQVGRVTNDDYLDVLEGHVEASGAEVIVLDLFDRCLRDRSPSDEQEAVWRVIEFTDSLRIHTVLVHQQLLKGSDVRADKRPTLEGIKGSSAYVDAGATILAPHLPARWKDVPDDTLEIYGLKQRFGKPFAVEFDWDPDTARISGGRSFTPKDVVEQPDEAFGTPNSKRDGFHGKRPRRKRD